MGRKTIRVLVCSAVCIVILSTVGHAFGFFSASGEMGGTEARMGGISLHMEGRSEGGVRALEWTGLSMAHVALEQETHRIAAGGGEPNGARDALDANFDTWWREHGEGLGNFLRVSTAASPGGFLAAQYAVINESTVPVYLRIEKPQIRVADGEAPLTVAVLAWAGGPEPAQADWPYDSTRDHLLVDGGLGDGYLYLAHPVAPGQRVPITFVAYIPSLSNGNWLQTREVTVAVGAVQLIQAQNNAVYLDDEWKRAADGAVNFVPYTETEGVIA